MTTQNSTTIDIFKLNHWLNAKKITQIYYVSRKLSFNWYIRKINIFKKIYKKKSLIYYNATKLKDNKKLIEQI
jgi:hypothetical protein